MRSQELRAAFVEFFTARGHKHVPSASLIPDAMSTTLFTIAGMEPFVPAFLGDEPPPAPRVVSVQRCLRVAGAKSTVRKTMIIALARKLLIALWRYVTTGVAPEGVVLRAGA